MSLSLNLAVRAADAIRSLPQIVWAPWGGELFELGEWLPPRVVVEAFDGSTLGNPINCTRAAHIAILSMRPHNLVGRAPR